MFFGRVIRQAQPYVFSPACVEPSAGQVLSITNVALAKNTGKGGMLIIKKGQEEIIAALLTVDNPSLPVNLFISLIDGVQLLAVGDPLHVTGFFEPDTAEDITVPADLKLNIFPKHNQALSSPHSVASKEKVIPPQQCSKISKRQNSKADESQALFASSSSSQPSESQFMHLDSGESDINDTFSESEEKQQTSIGNGLIVEDKKVRNAKEESNEKCGSGKIFPNIFYADNVGNKRLKKGMLGKH